MTQNPTTRPTLTVRIEENGSCTVEGPISDKVLSYGMLEMARDAILEFHQRAAAQRAAKGPSPIVLGRVVPDALNNGKRS